MDRVKKVKLQLFKGNKAHKMIFLYNNDTVNMIHQMRYYSMQGCSIKDEEVYRMIYGYSENHQYTSVFVSKGIPVERDVKTRLEREGIEGEVFDNSDTSSDILHTKTCIDNTEYDEDTRKITDRYNTINSTSHKWMDRIISCVDIDEYNIDGIIDEFIHCFKTQGLYDVKSLSRTCMSTLHIFNVLLDIHPDISRRCISMIDRDKGSIPYDYTDDVASYDHHVCKICILILLIECDVGSSTFVNALSYIENRYLLRVYDEYNLIVGDMTDSSIFGFKSDNHMKKKINYYKEGMKNNTIREVCKYRILGLLTIKYDKNIDALVDSLVGVDEKEFNSHNISDIRHLSSIIVYSDFIMLFKSIPMNEDERNMKSILVYQYNSLNNKDVNREIKILDIIQQMYLRDYSKSGEQMMKILNDLGSHDKYVEALDIIIDAMIKKMHADRFVEILYFTISMLKEMKQKNKDFGKKLDERHIIRTLEKIQSLLLSFLFQSNISRVFLYVLGRTYHESYPDEKYEGSLGLDILKLLFLMPCKSITDYNYNKRTISFISKHGGKDSDQVDKETLDIINNDISINEKEADIEAKLSNQLNDILSEHEIYEFDENEVKIFSTCIKNESLRPSVANCLEEIKMMLQKTDSNLFTSDISSQKESMEYILRSKDEYTPSFMEKLEKRTATKSNQNINDTKNQDNNATKLDKLANKIRAELKRDEKLKVFDKNMFDVYDEIEGLESFEYNECRIYKGYFISNKQKCTIFEVDYGESLSINLIKSLSVYVKMFHPKIVCFYGMCIDVDNINSCIKVCYIAEHFSYFLGSLSLSQVQRISEKEKILALFNTLYSLYCFHSVGLCFDLLNPDMITFNNGTPKIIFPFFLKTRIYFGRSYLKKLKEENIMHTNLLFINPVIVKKPELVYGSKVNIFTNEFESVFKPLMSNDLYSFILLAAYLLNPSFFEKTDLSQLTGIDEYIIRCDKRKDWVKEIIEPTKIISPSIEEELLKIFLNESDQVTTFELYDLFCSKSNYDYPLIGLDQAKIDIYSSLSYYNGEDSSKSVYFPCNTIIMTNDDASENRIYLNNKLLILGPYFYLDEQDSQQFDLFASLKEMLHFELSKGSIERCKVIFKTEKEGKIVPEQKFLIENFHMNALMPLKPVLESVIQRLKSNNKIDQKDKTSQYLQPMEYYMGSYAKISQEIQMIDPFGNYLKICRNKIGFPDFTGPFSMEAFCPHNFSKVMVSHQSKYPDKFFMSKISSFCIGEFPKTPIKYAELFSDFDQMNLQKSFTLSPMGFVYGGSLDHGLPVGGNIQDSKGMIQAISDKFFSEGQCPIKLNFEEETSDNIKTFKGEFCQSFREGNGIMYKNKSQQVYKGCWKNGYPHGKGELYHKESPVFYGLFNRGNPVYGVFVSDRLVVNGRSLVRVSRPKGKEKKDDDKNVVYNSIDETVSMYMYGFNILDTSDAVFCEVMRDMKLLTYELGNKQIYDNVIYNGEKVGGRPSGRGKARIDKIGTLEGEWSDNSDKRGYIVVGYIVPLDKIYGYNKIYGVFDCRVETNSMYVDGYGSVSLDGEKNVEGRFKGDSRINGFVDYCSIQEKRVVRNGKISSELCMDGLVYLHTVDNRHMIWYEYWSGNQLVYVYNNSKSMEISNISCDFTNKMVVFKGEHIDTDRYKLTGCMWYDHNGVTVDCSMLDDGRIYGIVSNDVDDSVCVGMIDNMECRLGRATHRSIRCVKEGRFRAGRLHEEGRVTYSDSMKSNDENNNVKGGTEMIDDGTNEGKLILYAKYKQDTKEGTVIVDKYQDKLQCVFIGSYQNDIKHGIGIRYYDDDTRQIVMYDNNDIVSVCEEEKI